MATATVPSEPFRGQAACDGSGAELRRILSAGLKALFVERLPLAGMFLLLGWPYWLLLYVRGRRRGATAEKVSPFIYTMQ